MRVEPRFLIASRAEAAREAFSRPVSEIAERMDIYVSLQLRYPQKG